VGFSREKEASPDLSSLWGGARKKQIKLMI